jgi:hypothetical protein
MKSLKYERGAVDTGKDELVQADSLDRPDLVAPESFRVLSAAEAADATIDAHGIERKGFQGGRSAHVEAPQNTPAAIEKARKAVTLELQKTKR